MLQSTSVLSPDCCRKATCIWLDARTVGLANLHQLKNASLLRNLKGEQELSGRWGGWLQSITQSSSLPLEFSERGFLESELVNGWVRFLVGLLVFKQVVDEASQFACSGRCGLGRS